MTDTLTLRRPDDWHLHLRDGAMLEGVLPETARHFARAIPRQMPQPRAAGGHRRGGPAPTAAGSWPPCPKAWRSSR